MFSVNSSLLLVCSNRVRLLKVLVQSRTLGCVCPHFGTSSVHTCKKKDKKIDHNLFSPVNIEPSDEDIKVGEELSGKLKKTDLLKVINAFCRTPAVKVLAAENGLNESLCQKGIFSFRKYCIDSTTLPPDLHIVLSDLIKQNGKPIDIFPYFLRHVKEMFPHLECMEDLRKIGDIRQPANWYPEARALKRKFYFHCGPTNSGKTYNALQSFYNSESGIYCAPLKLLAVEVHRKSVAKGIPCDLFTGEDVIYVSSNGNPSPHLSCTIEMCPLDKQVDVAVIDEIQMLRDQQRGWAWTRALLGLRAKEIHICGEEAALEVVDSILCTTNEEFEVKRYDRLSKLTLDKPLEDLRNVQPGDCIVCFNKSDIYTVASALEALKYKVAIVYGSLPPHTKLAQCEKFNDPNDPCKILVATDAIGMGLNLNIRRIVFYTLTKYAIANEMQEPQKITISVSQALQIAGRAGRFGTSHSEGLVTTFKAKDMRTLNFLLHEKPETIERAGILPTIDQIEMFSYYLPNSSLSELLEILVTLSTLDNSVYFMCEIREIIFLAQLIDHIALPLRVKYVFCCAPVNRKLHFSCVMFIKFARMFGLNQAVNVKWVCNKIGWPLKPPENLRDLQILESYHEVLDLYLWLSNRFVEFFPDGDIIRKIQKEIDILIYRGVHKLTSLSESDSAQDKKKTKLDMDPDSADAVI